MDKGLKLDKGLKPLVTIFKPDRMKKSDLDIHRNRLGTIVGVQGGPVVFKIPDGPLFIIEEMPWIHSATIGFFIGQGSGYEPLNMSGITHFIEHMIFKGTKTRTPRKIVLAFESVGGVLNASTGKESMNVFGRIGERYVKRGFNVIADMFLNPRFLPSDIEKERRVVYEELKMNKDVPALYLYEKFSRQLWGKSSLARPVAGSEKTLEKIDSKVIADWFENRFKPEYLIISIAGKVDAMTVAKWWQDVSNNRAEPIDVRKIPRKYLLKPLKPKWNSGVRVYRKDVEQATMIFAFPAPNVQDDERYSFTLLESILGGGMGARLFQSIREKLGLAYDIDTGYSPMRGTGVMTIDSATVPQKLNELVRETLLELKKLKDKKVGKSELKRVKDYLEGSTYLGMESSSSRMLRNALGILYLGSLLPAEIVMKRLEKVTTDDVQKCARKYFTADNVACAVLLPENHHEDDKTICQQIEKTIREVL